MPSDPGPLVLDPVPCVYCGHTRIAFREIWCEHAPADCACCILTCPACAGLTFDLPRLRVRRAAVVAHAPTPNAYCDWLDW